jgi:Fuc2NAc and GlcNAc transferase
VTGIGATGLAAAAAFLTAWAGVGLIRRAAPRAGLVDVPGSRSSHGSPTPRGGGVGLLAGVLAGAAVLAILGLDPGPGVRVVLLALVPLCAVGLWDDMRGLSPWLRLLVHIGCACAAVAALGGVERLPLPPPLDVRLGAFGAPLAVLWIVVVANFFNFMDGIDWLAGGQAAASCIGALAAGWSAGASSLSALLLAASLGFLVWNRPPARIFLGDSGSVPLGFALAALALLAPAPRRPEAVLAMAIGLALFLLDPVETLVRRGRRGEPLTQAHRSHAYQQFVAPGAPHGRAAAALVLTALLLSILGALSFLRPALAWPACAAALAVFAAERALASRAARRLEPGRPMS